MPAVDFYIIQQSNEAERLFFTCRLLEKISTQGLSIYVHTESEQSALALDDLLWSYRPESFLPHSIYTSQETTEATISIGFSPTHSTPKDVLVNLATELPTFHSGFSRIAEIIRNEETCKQIGRQHWMTYKGLGYELIKRDI